MPTSRASASAACHARPASMSSSAGKASRWAASHDRTSSAKARSSSVKARSIGLEVPEPVAAGLGEPLLQLRLLVGAEGSVHVVAPLADPELVAVDQIEP